MSSPFDANDEISLARECVKNCRWRSLYVLLCILSFILCRILVDKIPSNTGTAIVISLLAVGLLGTSVALSYLAIRHGLTYLLKYRHTKQGIFSAIGGLIFSIIWLFLLFGSLLG